MKKKNSIAKFSITKNTVAKLNTNSAVPIVGGQVTGHVCFNNSRWCQPTGQECFNNTGWCQISYEESCYGMCADKYATVYCDAS